MMSPVEEIRATVEEFEDRIEVKTDRRYKLIVQDPRGHLACFLMDEDMIDTLPLYSYEIHDQEKKIIEGETDDHGHFIHENFPADHYILITNGQEYLIPTLQEDDDPYHIRVIGEKGSSANH